MLIVFDDIIKILIDLAISPVNNVIIHMFISKYFYFFALFKL